MAEAVWRCLLQSASEQGREILFDPFPRGGLGRAVLRPRGAVRPPEQRTPDGCARSRAAAGPRQVEYRPPHYAARESPAAATPPHPGSAAAAGGGGDAGGAMARGAV